MPHRLPGVQTPEPVLKVGCKTSIPSTPSKSLQFGAILFILILVGLLAALASGGQELPCMGSGVAGGFETVKADTTLSPSDGKPSLPALATDGVPAIPPVGMTNMTVILRALESRVSALDERLTLSDELNALALRRLRAEARIAQAKSMSTMEASVTSISHGLLMQTLGFTAIVGMLIGLIYMGSRRTMEVEKFVSHTTATPGCLFEGAKNKTCSAYGVQVRPLDAMRREPTRLTVAATRAPQMVPLDSPELQAQLIANATLTLKSLRVFPVAPVLPWQIGVTSMKGNVRPQNQDVGVGLAIGEYDILIVADGCGGIPHGREAAYLVVASAGMRLIQILGTPPRWRTPDVEEAIRSAIWAAHHQLALQADDFNIACGDINGGLRSTLICVVGFKNKLHYGYVGDGGGWIVRATGAVERFLEPQKSATVLNILDASMGPLMAGSPVVGTLDRDPGDLAMIGSDGVFDRIPASEIHVFGRDILRACIRAEGDLQSVTHQVCREYAELQDAAGFICDDNLTIGLLGTRSKPVLGPGFWSGTATPAKEI